MESTPLLSNLPVPQIEEEATASNFWVKNNSKMFWEKLAYPITKYA